MGEVHDHMVVLYVLARLVIARRLLDLALGEAVGAGHAQMAEPGLARAQAEQQVFRPPADGGDGLALERAGKATWKRKAQILAVEGDLADAGALEIGRKAAADGFDFWEFRHWRTLKTARLRPIPSSTLLLYRHGQQAKG